LDRELSCCLALTRQRVACHVLLPCAAGWCNKTNEKGRAEEDTQNGGPFGMIASPRPTPGASEIPATPLLEIAQLTMRFGGIVALENVSFTVSKGRIAGLIGPNGAGKTTLFNCLSRLYRPERGDIRLNGRSLRQCAAADMAAMGIGRTFQSPALFGSMTVLDNVKVGGHARGRNGAVIDALTVPSGRREERELDEAARAMLAFVGLEADTARPAAALSFAARKRVELARALTVRPSLLLLDEPAGGLNHEEVGELGALIRSVRDQLAITILLVEHHMGLVMSLSEQVVVLNFGRVIADGTPAVVRADPAVAEAYLGTRH
jgi:branched-chain amino acid transport system ATP-binding protein